jgi:hypothetical protein
MRFFQVEIQVVDGEIGHPADFTVQVTVLVGLFQQLQSFG